MAEINDLSTTDASNTARFPENQAASTVNDGARALEGILARWAQDTNGSLTSGGSSNAYTLSANQTLTAYAQNMVFIFEANHTNTGAATLNVDSIGAKSIKKHHDVALAAGDIEQYQLVIVAYEGNDDCFQLLSATAVNPQPSVITTRGDVIRGSSAGAAERLAVGSTGELLASDGNDLVWKDRSYDVPFIAGFDADMVAEDVAVATYGELVMGRTGICTGASGYIDTAATGQAVIVDVEKNGTSIYTTPPQFGATSNAMTAGTLKSDGTQNYTSGDRLTFKVTQIGSGDAGAGCRFTLLTKQTS